MSMVTKRAAGAGVVEKKYSLVSLFHRLRFIEIAIGTDDSSSILWPCLEFEDFGSITKDVKTAIRMNRHDDVALILSAVRQMQSPEGTKGQPVALLLGKTVPNQNRCVWFQGELLGFFDYFGSVVGENVAGLRDAMQVTEPMLVAGLASTESTALVACPAAGLDASTELVACSLPKNSQAAASADADSEKSDQTPAASAKDSTTAVGQSVAIVTHGALPKDSNKATAVEKSQDQGSAVEAKSTAVDTSSSNDEEAVVPQNASIAGPSKDEEAIAPKESSIPSEQDAGQTRKIGASSFEATAVESPPEQGCAAEAMSTAVDASSSNVEEVTAPKEPSIESEQDAAQTRKTGASSSKATEVESPPDQGNAVEANSTAMDTSSSNDEEVIAPHRASIECPPKDAEVIAPKENIVESEHNPVQTRRKRASSKDAEVIAPKKASVQDVVPLTTKTRASSSRKRPKTAKPARVSLNGAFSAEVTVQSEQDSPIADSSTTSNIATRRAKQLSGSKRKRLPTVALSGKKQAASSTQSKKAKKTDDSTEVVITIFEEVRTSLERGGYVFRDGVYCRPGMDPAKNENALLGEGYFEDEQSFRKHLCAFGVDGDRDKWTEEDESLIQEWVRHAVVKRINEDGVIPEYDQWSGSTASNFLLKRLGFRRLEKTRGLRVVYVLPEVPKGAESVDVNCFDDSQDGIWSHLARFGLPDNCHLSGVSDREILNLELYICSNKEVETFYSGKLQGPGNGTSPGISASQSNVSGGGRPTRSLRNRPVDDNATTITVDSVGVGMRKTSKKQSDTGKAKKKRGRPAKATTTSSAKQHTTPCVSTPAFTPESESRVEKQLFPDSPTDDQDADLSPEIELETNQLLPDSPTDDQDADLLPEIELETHPLPEFEGTAEEKLSASLDALKMTHQAENNSFYRSGTHFASNLKTILNFLRSSIASEGVHGGNKGEPAALYVCGVPGIGKTSGVKWCCTKAIEETTGNSKYDGPTPTVVHINASHLSSAAKPERILLTELAGAVGMPNPEKQQKLSIWKRIKKEMILVVVDEIDLLVSNSNQEVEGRLSGTEGVLQTVLDYAGDESMPFAVIGISNSSANDKYHRLNEIGKFKDTVTFSSYSKDDLIGIVQARIGSRIVHPKALEFIAMKVAQNTGDARSVLDMTTNAIERRLLVVRDGGSLPADQNAPLVTMADVMPQVKKTNAKIAETIEGLPAMGKAILCVLASLARAGAKSTTLGKLKRFVSDAMSESQQEELLTLEDFKALVETLLDNGLLSVGGSIQGNLGMGNLQMMPISLGSQLEDVEVAIANGLGKERFYENLCEFTKKNTDRL